MGSFSIIKSSPILQFRFTEAAKVASLLCMILEGFIHINNYRKFCPEQIHCFHLGTIKMNLKCIFFL